MNPLEKASIGTTGLATTRLGLGTAALPGLFHSVAREEALGAIEQALKRGLNFIDTAPMYGHGYSEELLGEVLPGVPRESYVLSTKVGRLLEPISLEEKARIEREGQWRTISPFQWHFDFTRDAVLRSFESSLKRMKVDRIDVLLIHDPDEHWETAIREAYPAIHELRAQGVVKAIGAGMNQWQMLQRFAQEGEFDCFLLAGRYTLIDHSALAEFLPLCEKKGISIFLGGPYNSGILAGGTTFNYTAAPQDLLDRVGHIQALCSRHGVDIRAAALQFPMAHPAVVNIIPGARSVQQLDENLELLSARIPPEFWYSLREKNLLPDACPIPA